MHVVPETHTSNTDATSTALLMALGRVDRMFSSEGPGVHVLQGWEEAATCFQLVPLVATNYTLNTTIYLLGCGSHSVQVPRVIYT